MSDFSIYEKMRAADREVRLRRWNRQRALDNANHSDPDWEFKNKKMEYQLNCMQEIADEYRAKWDGVVPILNVDDGYMV